jgi:serine/threonine-protein kinase
VVLYQCLTGRLPFQGPTAMDTLTLVCEAEPPSPRSLAPGLDRGLEAICLECLEKDTARRYPTAQALADDLRRWLDGQAPPRPGFLWGLWPWGR